MLAARDLGMTNGDYVFYTIDVLPDEDVVTSEAVWRGNDGKDMESREAFEAVFHVSLCSIAFLNATTKRSINCTSEVHLWQ